MHCSVFTHKRSAKKSFGFFLKYWRLLIWPTYSDRSRSIFFSSPWPSRTLLWQMDPWWSWSGKKVWPWNVTVSRSNEQRPRLLSIIHPFFICRLSSNSPHEHRAGYQNPVPFVFHVLILHAQDICFKCTGFYSLMWYLPKKNRKENLWKSKLC